MNKKIDAEIAEILGAFIGDGWIEKRGTGMYIAGSITEDKEYYDNFLAPLFSKKFIEIVPKMFPYWSVYGIGIYKRSIINYALSLGFQSGKKCYSVSVPQDILKSTDLNIISSVLRGIFDTDGSFYCKKAYGKYDKMWFKEHNCKPKIEIDSVSKLLMEDVGMLLEKLGIHCKLSECNPKSTALKNNSRYYRVIIWRLSEIDKFFRLIGSHNPRQRTRYEIWKKLGYLPPYTTLMQRKAILAHV